MAKTKRLQCPRCREIFTVRDLRGRDHVACPMCGMAVHADRDTATRLQFQQDLREALDLFKLRLRDRLYAELALDQHAVNTVALHGAIRDVRRQAIRGRRVGVGTVLLKRSAIERKEDRALRDLVRARMEQEKQHRYMECQSCGKLVPTGAESCPYCGEIPDLPVLYDRCANCGREQPAGEATCQACGADMKTGLKPGMSYHACAHCNCVLVDPTARYCPRCHTDLRGGTMAEHGRNFAKRLKHFWTEISFYVVIVIIACGIYWAHVNWELLLEWSNLEDRPAASRSSHRR